MFGSTMQNNGLGSTVIELRGNKVDEKPPAPYEVCRGTGLQHGVVCSECQGKVYRLREMTEPDECAVCGIGAYRIERDRGYLRGAQRQ